MTSPLLFERRRYMANRLVDLKGKFISETERAFRVDFDGRVVWLPKSQVERDETDETYTMPEWLAIEKEIV